MISKDYRASNFPAALDLLIMVRFDKIIRSASKHIIDVGFYLKSFSF